MQEINPQSLKNAKLVDRYSRYIKSPDSLVNRLPVVGTLQHRALLIVELSKVLPVTEPAPLALRMTALLYRLRYAVYAACLIVTLAVGVGLGYAVMSVASRLFVST